MKQPRKIIIIGDAARGKSTLATRLSEKLNIPKYSTDDYYYEVKFSKPRGREEAIKTIAPVYQSDAWIVEGTTQWLLTPGLDSTDLIIHLRHNLILSQWFVLIKREFKRREATLVELLKLMIHVVYKKYRIGYKKDRPTHTEVLVPHKDKVVVLSSFKAIDDFLTKDFDS